jgi:hypothetical protein
MVVVESVVLRVEQVWAGDREAQGIHNVNSWAVAAMRSIQGRVHLAGNKKKKQINTNYTQEGISVQGRENKGTGSGGGIRKHRVWNENLIITITRNHSRSGWNAWKFIITSCKRGGRSVSRRSPGGREMSTMNGDIVMSDRFRSNKQARHLGLRQKGWDGDSSLGVAPKRTTPK